jgi:S-(hydroxymethyl)glutathione dehydrogenase/alcohol dehydrogenase
MRAAVFTGEDQLSVEQVEPLPPGPKDVLVQVAASGVCHSDLAVLNRTMPIPPDVVLGHEGAGVVLEVGSAVEAVRPGDTVIASFVPGCGQCFHCRADQAHLCTRTASFSAVPRVVRGSGGQATAMLGLGTFAELMTLHERSVVPVRTELPADQLALIGCGVTTGVGAALNTAKVQPGSTVAVLGCGGVGCAVIQGARVAGAARIIAIDRVEFKRKTAEQFGATDLVDPAQADPLDQVKALTGGLGVDYAFEVIGQPETMLQTYLMARRGGTATIIGMPRPDATVTFPARHLLSSERRLLGCVYGSAQVKRDFQRFVDLAEAGRLDLGRMVTQHIALDEINDAFRAMVAGEVVRSVIDYRLGQ